MAGTGVMQPFLHPFPTHVTSTDLNLTMNEKGLNQAEHQQISTSLEVEQIGENLFRSKFLWVPLRARGVYGGSSTSLVSLLRDTDHWYRQIISQALVSATNCVDSSFALHSLHCYFLLSSSGSIPIEYSVERLRDGKSYLTCSVTASQKGKKIFSMLCSFQRPEIWQPNFQWPMPDVRPPEECDDEEVRYSRVIDHPHSNKELVKFFKERLVERKASPIAIKMAKAHHVNKDGTVRYMYWMKARNIPHYEAPYQKYILAYISDLHFISSASRILGMKRGGKGSEALSMTSTLDHSIWFYDNDFDAGDWLLYEMDCPRGGSGRGIVHGRIFTHCGTLIAVCSQEGVIRANVRDPAKPEAPAKL